MQRTSKTPQVREGRLLSYNRSCGDLCEVFPEPPRVVHFLLTALYLRLRANPILCASPRASAEDRERAFESTGDSRIYSVSRTGALVASRSPRGPHGSGSGGRSSAGGSGRPFGTRGATPFGPRADFDRSLPVSRSIHPAPDGNHDIDLSSISAFNLVKRSTNAPKVTGTANSRSRTVDMISVSPRPPLLLHVSEEKQ